MNTVSKDTEVLVIGASLAGLVAATEAAKGGARTLLVDAAPEIGGRANPANVIMEPLWPTRTVDIPEQAVTRDYEGVEVAGPSGTGPIFRFRAVHVDRRQFDSIFAQNARDAGAQTQGNVSVRAVTPPNNGGNVQVHTDDGTLEAPVVIFADGAGSTVQQAMTTMKNPKDVSWGLDQLLEAPGLGESPFFHVRFGSFAPGWRVQLNPLGGDRANLWTFRRGGSKDELDDLSHRARKLFPAAEHAQVLDEARGADPAFVAPARIASDGLLACGAAAGQGGLENGAYAGFLAGTTAAKALKAGDVSSEGLSEYQRAWRKKVVAELIALKYGISSLRHLSDHEIDTVFASLAGEEFSDEQFKAVLRGNPTSLMQRVGPRTTAGLLLTVGKGWVKEAATSTATSLTRNGLSAAGGSPKT